MTFDHLPGQKKIAAIAELVKRGCTGLAEAEILKCEVVCANCHAVRTYERREAERRARAIPDHSIREGRGRYASCPLDQIVAAETDITGGRYWATSAHVRPSSALPQTSPPSVPK